MSGQEGSTGEEDNWIDLIRDSIELISNQSVGISSDDEVDLAWSTLVDVADDVKNHSDLLLPEFGLMNQIFASTDCKNELSDLRRAIIWTLILRLCKEPANESHFVLSQHSAFPATIVTTIQTGSEEVRVRALCVLCWLGHIPSNRALLIEPQYQLLPVLSVLMQFDEDSITRCCDVLLALAEDYVCGTKLCIAENLLSTIIAVFSLNKIELSTAALAVIDKFSLSEENREHLLGLNLNLVPTLLSLMETLKDAVYTTVSSILHNISKLLSCCVGLAEYRKQLFPALMMLVKTKDDSGLARIFSLYTILNLIKINNHLRDEFGAMELDIYCALVKIIQEPFRDNNALMVACQILNRLSFSKQIRDKFLWDAESDDREKSSDDLVTASVKALLVVIRHDEGIGRVVACSFIWNIISDTSFTSYMFPIIPDLIPILTEVVKTDDKTYARLKALGIMCNIIRFGDHTLKAYIALPELGLVNAVAAMLVHSGQCKPEELLKACNIIDALCFSGPVSGFLLSDELNLLPALVRLMRESSSAETVMHICSIIWNLSVHNGSGLLFKSMELNMLSELANIVYSDDNNGQYKALGALCNLAVLPQARQAIGSPALRLLPLLCRLVPTVKEDKTRELMLKLLSFISLDEVVVEHMVDVRLGLVKMLVRLIDKWEHNGLDFPKALPTILWNLSCISPFSSKAKDFCEALPLDTLADWIEAEYEAMVQASVYIITNSISARLRSCAELPAQPGFSRAIRALVRIFETNRDDLSECAIGGLWNIAESSCDEAIAALVQQDVHVSVLGYLRSIGPDKVNWIQPKAGSKSMNFLMNLAAHTTAAEKLKSIGTIDTVLPIMMLKSNGCECLKAMFIIAFLVGRDETEASALLLHARSDTISLLIQVLSATLAEQQGDDYPTGTFCIKLMIRAVLALAVSDKNKKELLQTPIIKLLHQVLVSFQRNDPEIPHCGGGGGDIDSAVLALNVLLHLSFVYENEEELQKQLIPPEMGFVPLLRDLISDESRLPPEALRTASQLMQRLLPVGEVLSASATGVSVMAHSSEGSLRDDTAEGTLAKKHVMVSYSQDESARPDLVYKLADRLRAKGYAVWVDIDGSDVVPAISGSIDDCMAEAVQCSDAVIICVSPKYKQSANCRMEATYANHLYKKGELRLCFVMMDEKYTTVTKPSYVDGWLGIMAGSSLWYPLWEESLVDQTAKRVSLFLGMGGKEKMPTAPGLASDAAAVLVRGESLSGGTKDASANMCAEELKISDDTAYPSSHKTAGSYSDEVNSPSPTDDCADTPPSKDKAVVASIARDQALPASPDIIHTDGSIADTSVPSSLAIPTSVNASNADTTAPQPMLVSPSKTREFFQLTALEVDDFGELCPPTPPSSTLSRKSIVADSIVVSIPLAPPVKGSELMSPPALRPSVEWPGGSMTSPAHANHHLPMLAKTSLAASSSSSSSQRYSIVERYSSPAELASGSPASTSFGNVSLSNPHMLSYTNLSEATPYTAALGEAETRKLCQTMWQLLTNKDKIRDSSGLQVYLSSLGISEGEELEYCEPFHVDAIASFLLPIPQKIFMKKMQRLFVTP